MPCRRFHRTHPVWETVHTVLTFGLASMIVFAAAAPARAQNAAGRGYAYEGVYVGVGAMPPTSLDNEAFSGDAIYVAEDDGEQFALPTLDSVVLPRVVVGFRSRPMALEFSYDRARYTGSFLGLPRDAVLNVFNVDGRFFFATRGRVQPHLVIGMAFPWLKVPDGSFAPESDFTDAPQGDATFRGYGLNTEVGVTLFVTPRVGVSAGYAWRALWFRRVRGIGDEPKELHPPFDAFRGHAAVMGFVTF